MQHTRKKRAIMSEKNEQRAKAFETNRGKKRSWSIGARLWLECQQSKVCSIQPGLDEQAIKKRRCLERPQYNISLHAGGKNYTLRFCIGRLLWHVKRILFKDVDDNAARRSPAVTMTPIFFQKASVAWQIYRPQGFCCRSGKENIAVRLGYMIYRRKKPAFPSHSFF